jgi:DNA-binding transcriptional LysR family regulator
VQVALALRANSATVLRNLAVEGHGVVVLPKLRAAEALAAGRLCPLLDEWRLPPLTLYATYAPGIRSTARGRTLVEVVRAQMSAG